jgi:hypothetical protein
MEPERSLELDSAPETNPLYPELASAGLANAIASSLPPDPRLRVTTMELLPGVVVGSEPRFAQIYAARRTHIYIVECWEIGIAVGAANTPNIDSVTEVVTAWILTQCSIEELERRFRFIPNKAGRAVMEDTVVESAWTTLMNRAPAELRDLIDAAARAQELRKLFPYVSLNRLCFSRCTGYPYTKDCPSARPLAAGRYVVLGPDAKILGEGDSSAAVSLLVEHLPPGIGAATAGTADSEAKGDHRFR